ncbi:uncharacterized protein LOC123934980 [Meles meles]|uniref:uncharacterized protein LOC123934980 n=1 Tax=Meles meles TaxID=9662 RepID=UPI001E69F34E|nr:uncharacterized protein LOC123934980 [Meles meles]
MHPETCATRWPLGNFMEEVPLGFWRKRTPSSRQEARREGGKDIPGRWKAHLLRFPELNTFHGLTLKAEDRHLGSRVATETHEERHPHCPLIPRQPDAPMQQSSQKVHQPSRQGTPNHGQGLPCQGLSDRLQPVTWLQVQTSAPVPSTKNKGINRNTRRYLGFDGTFPACFALQQRRHERVDLYQELQALTHSLWPHSKTERSLEFSGIPEITLQRRGN